MNLKLDLRNAATGALGFRSLALSQSLFHKPPGLFQIELEPVNVIRLLIFIISGSIHCDWKASKVFRSDHYRSEYTDYGNFSGGLEIM